jgi:beta-xylosidase
MVGLSTSTFLWTLITVIAGLVQGEPLFNDQVSLSKRATISIGLAENFPDPSIIKVNGIWYAFATHTRASSPKIQAASSPDFENWTVIRNADGTQYDAMPVLPAWVNQKRYYTWAPDVQQLVSKKSPPPSFLDQT